MPDSQFIKHLRTQMTDAERVLWRRLRAHRMDGEKFRRQQPIGPYVVDFVHLGARLIVEADGGQHNESSRDTERDAWLTSQGFRVVRFCNPEIIATPEAVLESILAVLAERKAAPLPNPSPAVGGGALTQSSGAVQRHDPMAHNQLSPPPRDAGGALMQPSGVVHPATAWSENDQSHSARRKARTAHSSPLADVLQPLPAARIVVGFSGGLDSSVLLHALAASPAARARGLRAVHVHHGLHADADAWAVHCTQVCDGLGIPLQILRVAVDAAAGTGPEGAARAARYQALRAELAGDDVLALAHHRDDQAETILLRLLRGAGGDGLAAMRRRSRLGPLHLWRPLLELPRSALNVYALANGLHWIEDPSNTDPRYDRNFLRHRVLPVLAERWPQASRNLARSAQLLAEQSHLLAITTATQLDMLTIAADTLALPGLFALPPSQRARVLRAWFARLELAAPSANILAAIERDLLPARADGDACVEWAGVAVQRWRDHLHVMQPHAPFPPDWSANWDGGAPLALPDGSNLELLGAAGFDAPLQVRARRGGERIRLPGRDHRHALKHVLQERAVPPWLRLRMPLLFAADGELLAAGDALLSASMDAWLRLHDARLRWSPAAGAGAAPN